MTIEDRFLLNIKRLCIYAAFGLTIIAFLIVLITGEARGYEISIYGAYPTFFWVLLLLSYSIGIFLLLYHSFSKVTTHEWLGGLGIILANNFLLFLLPFFRGYAGLMTFGSPHIGYTRDILFTGHIGEPYQAGENPFPAIHLVLGFLSLLTDTEPRRMALLVPSFYFALYTLSLLLLGSVVSNSKRAGSLLVAIAGLPLYSTIVDVPSVAFFIARAMFFSLVPLILYLFYRIQMTTTRGFAWRICLVLLLLTTPIYHFLEGLYLTAIFISGVLFIWLYRHITRKSTTKMPTSYSQFGTNSLISGITPALLLFVALLVWFFRLHAFEVGIEGTYLRLKNFIAFSDVAELVAIGERTGLSPWEIFLLAFKRGGHQWPYLITGGIICASTIIRLLLFKRNVSESEQLICSFLCVCVFFALLSIGVGGITGGSARMLPHAVLLSATLIALRLESLLGKLIQRKAFIFSCLGILLLAFPLTLGLFNIYGHPFNAWMNLQSTQADREGIDWLLNHQAGALTIVTFFPVFSEASGAVGLKSLPQNIVGFNPPFHFGYDISPTYGASIANDVYFVTNKMARLWEPMVYPNKKWRWSPEDYRRLEHDPSVSWLYYNGNFEVFYVKSIKRTP